MYMYDLILYNAHTTHARPKIRKTDSTANSTIYETEAGQDRFSNVHARQAMQVLDRGG
jgi:hypothetical protein